MVLTLNSILTPFSFVSPPASYTSLYYTSSSSVISAVRIPIHIQSLLFQPPLQQFHSICDEGRCYLIHACGFLRLYQLCISVVGYQQTIPSGLPDDGCDIVLYGQGVIKGDVAPHEIPPLLSCYHILYESKQIVRTNSCLSPQTAPIESPVLWHTP